eukprot:TRINITY_DN302_c0_g1_i1.p1 TRINITY_DN302_c0_g1~~TRINITY_DN302_c0_g1_i1.p1  ORF type:complete len:182 (+),score=50.94 TRINITY_DN302_c0_g1_i1:67-546(+)
MADDDFDQLMQHPDELLEILPREEQDADPLLGARVRKLDRGELLRGSVVSIWRGKESGETLYLVDFPADKVERNLMHMTADEVEENIDEDGSREEPTPRATAKAKAKVKATAKAEKQTKVEAKTRGRPPKAEAKVEAKTRGRPPKAEAKARGRPKTKGK